MTLTEMMINLQWEMQNADPEVFKGIFDTCDWLNAHAVQIYAWVLGILFFTTFVLGWT